MSEVCQNDTPVLVVLGKTRVGKGEYIRTAVRSLTGEELDISSSSIISHTKRAQGYHAILHGIEVVFYDTVGFGDSDCSNLEEESLFRMLEATGTKPFYPPLYILKDLDSINIDALRKLTSIFPEVCVAVRGSKEVFDSAADGFEVKSIRVSKIFRLPEFLTSVTQTKELYDSAVERILAVYASLTPTRKDLKFDSELFAGRIERIKLNTEKKHEDKVSEEFYTATETQIVNRERLESALTGYRLQKIPTFLGTRIMNCGRHRVSIPEFTVHTLKDEIPVTMEISRKKITTRRFIYTRDINQLYKVLAGNIRIYMRNETGNWRETGNEIIHVQDVKESRGADPLDCQWDSAFCRGQEGT